jgi:peptidoglycan/xylan/chitin deacetylase (PgdA/CDA1 family)
VKAELAKLMAFAVSKSYILRSSRQDKLKDNDITILCLHRVSDEPSLCWPPLPVNVFERLCQYWSEHYHVTDFRSLKNVINAKKPKLILSFDDGYEDFYKNAWPVLQRYHLKVNMNVVTSSASYGTPIWTQRLNNAFDALWKKGVAQPIVLPSGFIIKPGISKQQLYNESLKLFRFMCHLNTSERQSMLNETLIRMQTRENPTPFMTWEQIIDLHNSGVEIGSHTATHELLTNIEHENQLRDELTSSKNILEQKLGSPVQVIAFPNGFTSKKVNLAALDCGYEFLLGIEDALLNFNSLNREKVLPRILVHYTSYYENLMTTENFFSKLKALIK